LAAYRYLINLTAPRIVSLLLKYLFICRNSNKNAHKNDINCVAIVVIPKKRKKKRVCLPILITEIWNLKFLLLLIWTWSYCLGVELIDYVVWQEIEQKLIIDTR